MRFEDDFKAGSWLEPVIMDPFLRTYLKRSLSHPPLLTHPLGNWIFVFWLKRPFDTLIVWGKIRNDQIQIFYQKNSGFRNQGISLKYTILLNKLSVFGSFDHCHGLPQCFLTIIRKDLSKTDHRRPKINLPKFTIMNK